MVFFLIPKKLKTLWLLLASYYFYMSWNIRHTFLIAFSTLVTWVGGLLLGRCKKRGKKAKWIAAVSISLNLGLLLFFKYFDFLVSNLNFVLEKVGVAAVQKPFDFILPVGISFYTFQALGYLIDVYRRDIKPEQNLIRYALFVSFFPQMVIADRLCKLVDHVYASWYFYGTVELVVATAAFSIQIYCDFASYSTIAVGTAQVMGFTLMENFRTPYFSGSIREFWRRWHISLSTWFRDYLYIPLGGSRCGTVRRYLNLFLTFVVSGFWRLFVGNADQYEAIPDKVECNWGGQRIWGISGRGGSIFFVSLLSYTFFYADERGF